VRRRVAVRSLVWSLGAGPVILLAVAIVYHPPYFMISPGEAIDLTHDVTIEGAPVQRPSARYLLVTVDLRRPTALRALASRLNPDNRLLHRDAVIPRGVSEEEYLRNQRVLFRESQMAAAAAAAAATGGQVELDGHGARIVDLVEGSPAARRLRVGDVIIQVDGTPIRLVSDMTAITTTRPAGTSFEVTARRGRRIFKVTIPSARLKGFNASETGIGVRTTTDRLEVDLPFEVRFKRRPIAGPSAGLAYALAITDMLDGADLGRDRVIAATGAVRFDGGVGPVGGIAQKHDVARGAGAQLFFVPAGELDDVRRPEGVYEVGTLGEALALLRAS
jgi:PDZ domain-containing protein